MQPLISIENVKSTTEEMLLDVKQWQKSMVHYLKENNPEINTAIIEIAQKTDLDPKAVATGAFMVYKLLENESDSSSPPDDGMGILLE